MHRLKEIGESRSSCMPMLDPGPVHVGSIVDPGAQGLLFLRVLRFSHAIITPLVLHTQLYLHDDLKRTGARGLES